jgi:serine/threonine protein kinase
MTSSSALPDKIGRFQIEYVLGEGAQGLVFKAYDPDFDCHVAIKGINATRFLNNTKLAQETRERILREARAARKVQSENVAAIHEILNMDGDIYLVMEFVEGDTLRELLDADRKSVAEGGARFSLERKLESIIQVCNGLARAHSVGVIHRDIKPENIRLTKAGIAKILDFGLARLGDSSLTMNRAMGTPAYMAPEQWGIGGAPNHQSDIWSCGVILYEMLAGRRPFEGEPGLSGWERAMSIMQQAVNEMPPPLEQFSRRVPDELKLIVERTLQKSAKARYGSMEELIRDLNEAVRRIQDQKVLLEGELRKEAADLRLAVNEKRGVVTEALAKELLDLSHPVDQKLWGMFTGDDVGDGTVSIAPRSYSGLVFELEFIEQQRQRLEHVSEEAAKPPSLRSPRRQEKDRWQPDEPTVSSRTRRGEESGSAESETVNLADLEQRKSLMAQLEEAAELEQENRAEEANRLALTIIDRCEGHPGLGEVQVAANAISMRTLSGGEAPRIASRLRVDPAPGARSYDKRAPSEAAKDLGSVPKIPASSSKRKIAVWGILGLVGLVALGGYFLPDGDRPVPAAAPGRVWLGVSPWAEILWVRNADLRELVEVQESYAPCWLSLPAGRYEIGLANQFSPNAPLTLSVTVQADQTATIHETLPGFDYETIPIDF